MDGHYLVPIHKRTSTANDSGTQSFGYKILLFGTTKRPHLVAKILHT